MKCHVSIPARPLRRTALLCCPWMQHEGEPAGACVAAGLRGLGSGEAELGGVSARWWRSTQTGDAPPDTALRPPAARLYQCMQPAGTQP